MVGAAVIAALIIALLAVMIGGTTGDAGAAAGDTLETSSSLLDLFLLLPWNKLRTPAVAGQIITSLRAITGIWYPLLYRNFLAAASFLPLDLSWMLSAECWIDGWNFYDRLLIVKLAPLALLLLLGARIALIVYQEPMPLLSPPGGWRAFPGAADTSL
ncbi:unnamed protein product [Phaeothamnion confervicola]